MSQLLHPKIAQFLANDPHKNDCVASRRIQIHATLNRFSIEIRGITADGNRMETVDVIDATEPAAGSAPDGIERAIKEWLKQAGVEK